MKQNYIKTKQSFIQKHQKYFSFINGEEHRPSISHGMYHKASYIPEYTHDIDIGDRPPTHEICSGRRPCKKKKYLSAIPEQGRRT